MVDFNDRRRVDPTPTRGTISHARARELASAWSDNLDTPGLHSLSQEGRVPEHALNDIDKKLEQGGWTKKGETQLRQLRRYAERNTGRGPVRDWTYLER